MAERYIPEHRRTQFKAKSTFKPEELRRRREEAQVEIRKAKREENLAKRRGIGTGENRPGASLGAAPDSDDENPPSESQVCSFFSLLSPYQSSVQPFSPSPPRALELPAASRCIHPTCTPLLSVVATHFRHPRDASKTSHQGGGFCNDTRGRPLSPCFACYVWRSDQTLTFRCTAQ